MLNKRINWYKIFFAKYYLSFLADKKTPSDTRQEVRFILRVLSLSRNAKILDLACGFGRHAIELAKRKFKVTGLDLNKQFIIFAKQLAKKEKVSLNLIHSDMREIPFENEFDAVISMFTSFGYFVEEKENLKVLKGVFKALKPKGLFLLDLMNKKMILQKYLGRTWRKVGKNYILEERLFNQKRKYHLNKILIITPQKEIKKTFILVHLYDPFEIKKKLEKVGFRVLKFYGDYKGNKFFPEKSPRMIILAKKPFSNK